MHFLLLKLRVLTVEINMCFSALEIYHKEREFDNNLTQIYFLLQINLKTNKNKTEFHINKCIKLILNNNKKEKNEIKMSEFVQIFML